MAVIDESLLDKLEKATQQSTLHPDREIVPVGWSPDEQRAYATGKMQGRTDLANAIRIILRDALRAEDAKRVAAKPKK